MQAKPIDLVDAQRTCLAHPASPWSAEVCGITRASTPIPALLHADAYVPASPRTRVLLLAGLSGQAPDTALALQALDLYLQAGAGLLSWVALSAIPCGNPDGLRLQTGPQNGAGGTPSVGYPPTDHFYDDAHNPECRYIWRWIGMQAPALILELQAGPQVCWEASPAAADLGAALQATAVRPADSLLAAMGVGLPNGLGPIPGLRLTTPPEALPTQLARLWDCLPMLAPSPARRTLDRRRARSALEIARSLGDVYGHRLDPVVYTQGMAIEGRLWLRQLDDAAAGDVLAEIVRLVEPYVSGAKPMFAAQAAPHLLAGLTWTYELAKATGDQRYADLLIGVANRYQPAAAGTAPAPSAAEFRTEDMCMNGALLGRAFRLTGNRHYLDLLTSFLRQAPTQQANGLFWHSRSSPYYWGRGNGFAALGFCETLSALPFDHASRQPLIERHQRHLHALRQHQHASGMYPQVLDIPGSYLEFTATCMIGYAMARGLRQGWLDASYRSALDLAWQGVTERLDPTAGVVDACTNTGGQSSVRAYVDRPAIFGRDDRSGAMALWFAIERARLEHDDAHSTVGTSASPFKVRSDGLLDS
jgi:unsaturated rhamnogalacturonyl hydrolase